MDGEDFARVLLPGCDGEVGHVYVEEFYRAVAAGGEELGLVCFGPGAVEEGVLRVEPGDGLACDWEASGLYENDGVDKYHFSATMPFAVRPNMYNRPFPTSPKLADVATAMRESKKGLYLTE